MRSSLALEQLDLAALHLIRAVVRHGSFTAAARDLGYSQSAASQRIRRLERAIGMPLFVRTNAGVRPTDAGRVLVARAVDAVTAVEVARQEIESLRDLRSGHVRVAAFPSVSATLLPQAIAGLRHQHPEITVTFQQHVRGTELSSVVDGTADISVLYSYDGRIEREASSAALDDEVLLRDRLDIALSTRHPLAWREHVALDQLAEETWLIGFHAAMLRDRARDAGFTIRRGHAVTDYAAAQAFVAAELGIAIMPRLVQHSHRHPGVVFRELRPEVSRSVHVVTRTAARDIPAIAALRDHLIAAAEPYRA